MRQDRLSESEASLTAALASYQTVHYVPGEANVMHSLGDLYMKQGRFGEAETSLTAELAGHQAAHDVLGEANV